MVLPSSVAQRLENFQSTIFTEMTNLANSTGAVNLGQGFPDWNGPHQIIEAAQHAMAHSLQQYEPSRGIKDLRLAISEHNERHYGTRCDPDTEVLVTCGATEAICAAMLGLINPGDEVICFDPAYDAYPASISMANGVCVRVPLVPWTWEIDAEELEAAVTEKTVAIVLNNPHNPTGVVFNTETVQAVADVCIRHDLLCICDEVYEHLSYGPTHTHMASLDGMSERTISISSGGKTFSLTGWKVGWVTGPAAFVSACASAKSFTTFTTPGALQTGIAHGLRHEELCQSQQQILAARRDQLTAGLAQAGCEVSVADAGYFAITRMNADTYSSTQFCIQLAHERGVVAIPVEAFCSAETLERHHDYSQMIRWAFCKSEHVIDSAVQRLIG